MLKHILELSSLLFVRTLRCVFVGVNMHLFIIEKRGHLCEQDLKYQANAVRACQEISDDTAGCDPRIMQCIQAK